MFFIKVKIWWLILYNMIPDRLTKMFARKLIFRTARGPIRFEYAQLLFVWVYRERRVRFYVISAPLKSWNPSYDLSNNNFSLLCPRLRDRSVALFHSCAEVLILWTTRSWNDNLMPYHSFSYVIYLRGFPLIRCEPKRICLLDNAQQKFFLGSLSEGA